MRQLQASEAKTHFLRLLDEVERGESVIITRHGKEVARIGPVRESEQARRKRTERAMQNILEIRRQTKPVSVEEILSARDEGRR